LPEIGGDFTKNVLGGVAIIGVSFYHMDKPFGLTGLKKH
jgi:hypothetical protein